MDLWIFLGTGTLIERDLVRSQENTGLVSVCVIVCIYTVVTLPFHIVIKFSFWAEILSLSSWVSICGEWLTYGLDEKVYYLLETNSSMPVETTEKRGVLFHLVSSIYPVSRCVTLVLLLFFPTWEVLTGLLNSEYVFVHVNMRVGAWVKMVHLFIRIMINSAKNDRKISNMIVKKGKRFSLTERTFKKGSVWWFRFVVFYGFLNTT